MREGLDAQLAAGATLFRPWYLCYLAEVCGTAERFKEGLAAVAEAIAIVEKTGERWFDAELYRLKGELLLKQDAHAESKVEDEAETCFRHALEIGRRQQARWWELRGTTSLARFLEKQGLRDEARAMLAEIYNWFTEGFDTADLKDAKALLDELSTREA